MATPLNPGYIRASERTSAIESVAYRRHPDPDFQAGYGVVRHLEAMGYLVTLEEAS